MEKTEQLKHMRKRKANLEYIRDVLQDDSRYSDKDVAELCRDICCGEITDRADILAIVRALLASLCKDIEHEAVASRPD
jgi:hypothetical protein